MKRLFKFKYPKFTLLAIAIILSYLIFRNDYIANFVLNLGEIKYVGLFIAGMLNAFGFTAPFAIGFLISYNPMNLWLAAVTATLGTVFVDLLIFNLIKFSFEDEIEDIRKTKIAKEIYNEIEKDFGDTIRKYLMYVFAGILIASPLPDEVGVTMLEALTKIKQLPLAIISFILHMIFIVILLSI